MWGCDSCGTTGIAASLDFCPTCRKQRPGQDVTAESGESQADFPGGSGDSFGPPEETETPPSPQEGEGQNGKDNVVRRKQRGSGQGDDPSGTAG